MKFIGELYREKVLSLPEQSLLKQEILTNWGGTRIEKDLFGWKLYYNTEGKKKVQSVIECRSEEAARYLKVFFDLGMKEVLVPKDDEYLKSILPELEYLKKRTDEILNSYLESILNRQIRERLKHEVYMEITQ